MITILTNLITDSGLVDLAAKINKIPETAKRFGNYFLYIINKV
jgi:hypothetical protein